MLKLPLNCHHLTTLAKKCSKFSKPGFNSTWTVNFYVFKLDLEKAEEPEIKLPTSVGSLKKQESSRKTSISALLTMPACDCVDLNKLWKILKRWEYQTTLPVSCETCIQVKKQQLELDMEQKTGCKLGKEWVKAVYCHPAYLTYMQSTLCEMSGWMKHKLGTRLWGQISITSDMQMTPPLRQKWAETKELLEGQRGEWKSWLKTQHLKIKIMASGSISSWQIDGETMETVRDFLSLASKNHCRWWLQP